MDGPQLSEQFSQQRMEKCAIVFRQILNNWMATNEFQPRIVADEPLEGKNLDQLGQMYLSVGVGDDLTDLPLLDALIVFQMLADHSQRKTERSGNREKISVKTEFSEDEVFALLSQLHTRVGVEIRPVRPAANES